MDATSRKPVRAITKLVAAAATGLVAAVLMLGYCRYWNFGDAIEQAVGDVVAETLTKDVQPKLDAIERDFQNNLFLGLYTDETDNVRAEMRGLELTSECEVRCLDDHTIWRPHLLKSHDLARGNASTTTLKLRTPVPQGRLATSTSTASCPAGELSAFVLVDAHGRVRGVVQENADTTLEIRPVGSGSVWKLDFQRSCDRYFGEKAKSNE